MRDQIAKQVEEKVKEESETIVKEEERRLAEEKEKHQALREELTKQIEEIQLKTLVRSIPFYPIPLASPPAPHQQNPTRLHVVLGRASHGYLAVVNCSNPSGRHHALVSGFRKTKAKPHICYALNDGTLSRLTEAEAESDADSRRHRMDRDSNSDSESESENNSDSDSDDKEAEPKEVKQKTVEENKKAERTPRRRIVSQRRRIGDLVGRPSASTQQQLCTLWNASLG